MSIDGIDKTRWSCPWNIDQNCTQNSARCGGVQGVVGGWVGGGGGPGVGGKRVKGSRGLRVVEGPGSREPRGIG